MRKLTLFLAFGIAGTLSARQSISQTMSATSTVYQERRMVVISDSTTRSSLLCSILPDQSGAYSPLIGTGLWDEKGKQVQVSSLLYFDLAKYGELRPNDIIKAWLLMLPVRSSLEVFNPAQSRIRIKRVLDDWADSTVNWNQRPATTAQYSYTYDLNKPDTSDFYWFNVTRLVRQMQKSGNHGFEISFNDQDDASPFGRLFYSPHEENKDLRPLLVLQLAKDYQIEKTYSWRDNLSEFARYNLDHPMYDRVQMAEYMKQPNVQPVTPPATPATPPAPPVIPPKSAN